MSETKNIVIIGASIAGHTLANALVPLLPTTHRILVVDASDYAYFPVAGIRAAVQPGWEKRVTIPLSTATFFPAGSEHQVIAPNKVVELKQNSIVLEKPFEGSTEVSFVKCVLATGALQPAPMRGELGSTLVDMQAALQKMQGEIAQAKKVVVIGGGPVGLEFAGEVYDRFPDTSITIVHNQPRVLNPSSNPNSNKAESWFAPASYPKLSTALEAELKALKIDVILNDRVEVPAKDAQVAEGSWNGSSGLQSGVKTLTLKSGKTIEADYVFVSIGNKSGAGLVEQADKGAIDGSLVRVDEYLRVKSNTPDSILGDYYAIGDVCNTPGWKTSQTAGADATYAATSILADVKGTKAKKYARSPMHALIIPLGASRGAGSITVPYLGTFMAPKMVLGVKAKDLFVGQSFVSLFKGAEKVTVPAA